MPKFFLMPNGKIAAQSGSPVMLTQAQFEACCCEGDPGEPCDCMDFPCLELVVTETVGKGSGDGGDAFYIVPPGVWELLLPFVWSEEQGYCEQINFPEWAEDGSLPLSERAPTSFAFRDAEGFDMPGWYFFWVLDEDDAEIGGPPEFSHYLIFAKDGDPCDPRGTYTVDLAKSFACCGQDLSIYEGLQVEVRECVEE